MFIPQIEPWYHIEDTIDAVSEYLYGRPWLTEYHKTRLFEDAIKGLVGAKYAYMVPNCTLALYAALTCLGIGTKDEVIIPAFTMIATANAVRMTGTTPVFVDVDETLCLDVNLIEEAITGRTKAVIIVDLNGRAPDIGRIRQICLSNKLFLIEDAAQAFGSQHLGAFLGTLGDVGCYSFSPHKIVTTGQGGCIVTNDAPLASAVHRFRNFGRRGTGGHDHDMFGINLKFTDLQAVVGLSQMESIQWRIERKKEIFRLYQNLLSKVLTFPATYEETTPWYVDVFAPDRGDLAAHLKENGIGTQFFYPVIPHTGAYKQSGSYPNAEYAAENGLWLPSSLTLTDDQIRMICDEIKTFYGGKR